MAIFPVSSVGAGVELAPSRSVVEQLYRDYAWVILFDSPGMVKLTDQPQQELSKYFTSSLANLINKDHECTRKTGDVCNLDFDPIYDSQDPDGAHQLRIEPEGVDMVHVTFLRRWSSPDVAELQFKMIRMSAGWRIDDIYYKGHESLRAILQQQKR
jgi:hypothetical protein